MSRTDLDTGTVGPLSRPRRNRKSPILRAFQRETHLGPEHLVLPLFIHDAEQSVPIRSMPGCQRLGEVDLFAEVERAREAGVHMVVLFPAVDEALKTRTGDEAWNPDGLVPRTLRALKQRWPDLVVLTDVALDPYNSDGHDGIVAPSGEILNDETVEVLCRQAVVQAQAGADIVAPSDMMDGRIGAIRDALDGHGFTQVSILSYCAKYASSFYGPFREALDSAPRAGDKKTYQMDPANAREALRELALDEAEGADIVMVKPAGPFLDIIRLLREHTTLPVAAYQVSGEYAMLKAAAQNGWLDERRAVLESLLGIRRAGADLIFTYYARTAAEWLRAG
ncbi:MAG: porphobilinogen synthase [Gemmatimonadaceae bacterium]|jgi:porphobilinogen synthase|nr:porphobilinogen synthase [Gemmatimonadaceae bacterium]